MLEVKHSEVLTRFRQCSEQIHTILNFFEENTQGLKVVLERTPEEIRAAVEAGHTRDGLEDLRKLEQNPPIPYIGPISFTDALTDTMERAERFREVFGSELRDKVYQHYGVDWRLLEEARRAILEEQRRLNEVNTAGGF